MDKETYEEIQIVKAQILVAKYQHLCDFHNVNEACTKAKEEQRLIDSIRRK